MSLFNDQLKKITLIELLVVIIILFSIQFVLDFYNIFSLDSIWISIIIILFFALKLRNNLNCVPGDIKEIFTFEILKSILIIVILNICLSYTCLFVADFISNNFLSVDTASNNILNNTLFAIILISPIFEELIFRGVLFNRLKLFIPTIFAVLISALIFASFHPFGNIFSSFIFGISMVLLYLKTENIFIPITAHFLNNLLAEIIVFIDKSNIIFNNASVRDIIAIVGFYSLMIIVYWIVKQLNSIKE